MIRMSVFYPAGENTTFDHHYFQATHVPLAVSTWNLEGAEIDKGVDGPHVAGVHFVFESLDQMQAAMAAEGTAAVLGDVPNYTNVQPVIQVSEIV